MAALTRNSYIEMFTYWFVKFDTAFTLGRVIGLFPVMIMSHFSADPDMLSDEIAAYQIALFLSTVVLYGAVQVYLVKQGIERSIFVFHMAFSTLLISGILLLIEGWEGAAKLLPPFIFLVIFRSYYLLFATYLKFDALSSLVLVFGALVVLAIYAATMSYFAASFIAVCFLITQIYIMGFFRLAYVFAAFRKYRSILTKNFSYFFAFLLQQNFTQISLVVYALVATGEDYIRATHIIYIFAVSFIPNSIFFRSLASKIGKSRQTGDIGPYLHNAQMFSLSMGVFMAVVVFLFYDSIENLLFGYQVMTPWSASLLGAMIILNSISVGWAALFIGSRHPYFMVTSLSVTTAITLVGVWLTFLFDVADGFYYSIILALMMQIFIRARFSDRVLHSLDSK